MRRPTASAQKNNRRNNYIIALDSSWDESKVWLNRLKNEVWGFKVGSILFMEKGPAIVEKIKRAGFRVFLDLKFHDIPNTVQHAVKNSFSWGVDLLTVHACGGRQMLEAAAQEQKAGKRILAVTVLTSLDKKNLEELGISSELNQQVDRMASLAIGSGISGLVCSPKEVSALRKKFSNALLVTPGVRTISLGDDQKRTETAENALKQGASMVVVGRALTSAKNWKEEWQKITSYSDETSSKKR